MEGLTPTQQRIIDLLPATPDEIAQALYGRATASERNLVYVHIALLRRRLNGAARVISQSVSERQPLAKTVRETQPGEDSYTCRIIYDLDP